MSFAILDEIGLAPPVRRAFERKARHEGKTTPEYLRFLIEREILASKSFDEILKPVRNAFKKGGMSEEKLDALVNEARRAHHARVSRIRRKGRNK